MRLRALLLAFPSLLLVLNAGAETLRLRADSWMPYNGAPADPLPGYAIEIARTIYQAHGITLDYQTMPWGDALKAAAAGEIEAVVGANKEEADGLVLPAHSIGLPRIALIVARENPWRYENVSSLRRIRLGVVLDYKYWPLLDDYIAKSQEPQVRKFSGDQPLDEALSALLAGQIDVIAETSSVFAWAIQNGRRPATAFRIVYLHEGDPVYFAFTAKSAVGRHYAKLFDDGLRDMRQNGELANILRRYGLSDWEQ